MAEQFFQRQIDYIFFSYGFAFILLAAICVMLRREQKQRLPWIWLGLFGLTHGISEWLEILAMSLGDAATFSGIRLGLMTLSFVFLFEFGREGFSKLQGKGPGRWIYIPLLVCTIFVGFADHAVLNAAFLYSLGLTGGLWSALSLFLASRKEAGTRRILYFSAAFMAGYALATGAVVPMLPFFPASVINHDSFLSFTGIPIQLIRGILAILIATTLFGYSRRRRESDSLKISRKVETLYELQHALIIVIVLAGGWMFTEFVGKDTEKEELKDILNQAKVAAASLNPERVKHLTDNATDPADPDYVRISEQLRDMKAGNPQFRGLYLMALKGGKILVTVDSSPQEEYGQALPVRGIYVQPPGEILDAFTSGKASVAGPYSDKHETFVTGFAPVLDPVTRRNIGILGFDINAGDLQKIINQRRMAPIFITLLISLLLAGFFIVRQRLLESAQLVAASERILTEAQKVAHLGSWTYDTEKDQLTWSEEMFNIFGLDPGGSVPNFSGQQQFIHTEDREKLDETLQKAIREGQESELEFRVIRPDGDMRHVFLKVNTLIGDAGVQMLGICQDITERKQGEEELRQLSVIDELTGLNNRRGFLILATQQLKMSDRSKQGAVLVYADMDKMKWVNDTLGHKEGDRALIDIAKILKSGLRTSDIIARWGGDEFVGLALESSEKAGEVILARLQEKLAAHNLRGHRSYKLSVSFGLTGYDPENPCALEELLERGDKLMYEEKQKRKMQPT